MSYHKACKLNVYRAFCVLGDVQVYVIESLSDGTRYTGMALNATTRLADHNNGKNRFTKGHSPGKSILRTMQGLVRKAE
ncbi:MAG: hypothetical protein IPG82_11445 [Saprospiraceae bacterium]|nr:hypothetical protein [Saprospiraceae bacterium]